MRVALVFTIVSFAPSPNGKSSILGTEHTPGRITAKINTTTEFIFLELLLTQ